MVMVQASLAHECCRSVGNGNMRDFIDLPGAQTTAEQASASLKPLLARKGISTLKAGRSFGIWYHSSYNVLAVQFFARVFYPQQFADPDA